ncbi:MAG: hypothetical protein AAB971_01205, partial [Patescibacteria group bacterium]
RVLTDGLNQAEVKSRLGALANTIDSRGWAIKHVDFGAHGLLPNSSDRLIDISSMPQEVSNIEVVAADDIMDAANNPIARQFDTMISQSSQAHRQQLVNQLNGSPGSASQAGAPANNNWFLDQASASAGPTSVAPAYSQTPVSVEPAQTSPVSAPTAMATVPPEDIAASEAELSQQLSARASSTHVSLDNMHTLRPASAAAQAAGSQAATGSVSAPQTADQMSADGTANSMTSSGDPAILSLANNNDLNVSTLAREAHKAKGDDHEVVVSLR